MKMCGENVHLIQSFKAPDRLVGRKIVPGKTTELWQTCGQKPGHLGPHGGYGSLLRHWRFKLECKLRRS